MIYYLRVCPREKQAGGDATQITNFAQTWRCLASKSLWQKLRLKYFIFLELGGPPAKMALCH